MNYFVFFFVVVSTLIDMALIYYSHFHGGDAVFQADGEFFTADFNNAVEKLAEFEEVTEFQAIQ